MADDGQGGGSKGGGGEEPEERTDGWMATYADMVTLLMTFFVLMFALSNADNEKMEMFMIALSRDGLSVEQFWDIQDKYADALTDEWDEFFPSPPLSVPGEEDEEGVGDAALAALAEAFGNYIEGEGLGEVMTLTFNGTNILLKLQGDVFFRSGSAEITERMLQTVEVFARMLDHHWEPDDPFEISVVGHTDNVPINTDRYPNNWYLSGMRAMNFLGELIRESGLDPGFFFAAGCGEERPVASNDTAEGREQNRRVEVMVGLARYNPNLTLPQN